MNKECWSLDDHNQRSLLGAVSGLRAGGILGGGL
jgi:hypothetical protein